MIPDNIILDNGSNMLENLGLENMTVGSSVRRNCPLCGGTQTLSITRVIGRYLFHCYRSSCKDKFPPVKDTYTIKDLQEGVKLARTEELTPFELPPMLRPTSSSKKAISMINDFNCMEPYHNGVFDSYYDPKEDRLCIALKDNKNTTVGMVGRSLSNAYPKVKIYDNSILHVSVFRPKQLLEGVINIVLVEDVFSAIAVTCLSLRKGNEAFQSYLKTSERTNEKIHTTNIPQYAGYPLLGTRLAKEHCNFLVEHYPKANFIVALDRDARSKMKAMVTTLRGYGLRASELELIKDIKNLTTDQISEILQYKINIKQ